MVKFQTDAIGKGQSLIRLRRFYGKEYRKRKRILTYRDFNSYSIKVNLWYHLECMKCPLCSNEDHSVKHTKDGEQIYWDCGHCGLIFLDEKDRLSPEEEKAHYETHNNDISDVRYQKFVSPIVNYISDHVEKGKLGLDYGAGTGPVISALLIDQGFEVKLYDPYFWDEHASLTFRYDFIIACEVIEHFYSPDSEFDKFKFLLNDGGLVAMMTEIYHDEIDFKDWYYHRDPTHVCFYRMETFEWIVRNYGFTGLERTGPRTILLSK